MQVINANLGEFYILREQMAVICTYNPFDRENQKKGWLYVKNNFYVKWMEIIPGDSFRKPTESELEKIQNLWVI
jgi:hypothetical protein